MEKLLALLMLHSQAFGSELGISYGVALPTDSEFLQQIKYGSVSLSEGDTFRSKYELGFFTDPRSAERRRSSAFGTAGAGLRPRTGSFLIESYIGVGGITHPDTNLGGWFNFFHDIKLGVIDKGSVSISISYKHISSAGINSPNKGRDFLLLNWAIPL
jgi:hypothetical protein